ncbi:MAG TPA: AraC family transcriptional regulator [Bacilli bacterium]
MKHGIDIYESKHSDGDLIKEHSHDFHQFLYVLDGKGEIILEGIKYDFEPNDGALIVPFSRHSVISNAKLSILVLAFREDYLDLTIQQGLLHTFFKLSKLIGPHPFTVSELRKFLRKMLFESALGKPINYLAIKIYLAEILLLLARSHKVSQITDMNGLRAERLRNYIDGHYYEITGSTDISGKLGVSARHMNNIFKEQYQITPIQYLATVRMELAKKLLTHSDKDIASICFEIGFESLSSFYRTFKNYQQTSPTAYRKKNHFRY